MGENFGLYISAGMASLPEEVGLDLWSVARSIKKQLEPALDPSVLSARYSALRSFLSSNPNPSEAYSHYRRGVRYHLVVSNKGRLPFQRQVGRLRIDAIWSVPNVEIEPFISLLTVGDRTFITAVAERSMRKLMDCTLMRIREALGLPTHRPGTDIVRDLPCLGRAAQARLPDHEKSAALRPQPHGSWKFTRITCLPDSTDPSGK